MDSYERKARPLNGLLQLRLSWYPIDVESESQTTTCLFDPHFVDEPLVDIRDLLRVVDQHGTGRPAAGHLTRQRYAAEGGSVRNLWDCGPAVAALEPAQPAQASDDRDRGRHQHSRDGIDADF